MVRSDEPDRYPRPFTGAQRLEYRTWLFGWLKELIATTGQVNAGCAI